MMFVWKSVVAASRSVTIACIAPINLRVSAFLTLLIDKESAICVLPPALGVGTVISTRGSTRLWLSLLMVCRGEQPIMVFNSKEFLGTFTV